MKVVIQKVNVAETYTLRHEVLRQGFPLSSVRFDGDELFSTFHFGAKAANQLVGIVSIYNAQTVKIKAIESYQLRGMAVILKYRRKKIGQQLVEQIETFLKEKNTTLLWMNARKNAVEFYKSLGYQIQGEPFEIESVGTHFLMYKYL